MAYTLDELRDDAAWYLQLRLSDGKALARVYDAAGLPEAGRSQTGSRGASSFTGKSREQGRGRV